MLKLLVAMYSAMWCLPLSGRVVGVLFGIAADLCCTVSFHSPAMATVESIWLYRYIAYLRH